MFLKHLPPDDGGEGNATREGPPPQEHLYPKGRRWGSVAANFVVQMDTGAPPPPPQSGGGGGAVVGAP